MGLLDRPNRLLCLLTTTLAVFSCACIVLCCVGFVRLEFKLIDQQQKVATLEREIQMCRKFKLDQMVNTPNRYRRAARSKDNMCLQCVKPWIREEVVSSVSYAVEAFCNPKSKLCMRGPPGPKGERGIDGSHVRVKNPGYEAVEDIIKPPEKRVGAINAPGIRVEPSSLIVNENSSATFSCSCTVAGKSSIVWDKVGGFPRGKTLQIKEGQLKLTDVQNQDEGTYMCTVESSAGLSRAVVTLKVRSAPHVFLKKGPFYAVKGENVTLPRCRATGFPTPVVSWLKVWDVMPEGRIVTSQQTMSLLRVRRSDSGIYLCKAKNTLGLVKAITHLVVIVQPKFVVKPPRKLKRFAGSALVVNCSANANPRPVITWERCKGGPLDKRFTVTHGRLSVEYLKPTDSGTYACVATSRPLIARAPFEIKIKIAQDCWELYASGIRKNGMYKINPDNRMPFVVYCDMTNDGGGWTVFQRRYDGSVNFFRGWKEYKSGFGNPSEEFWLGNGKIHRLTNAHASKLLVNVEDWEGNKADAIYSNFAIEDEKTNYKLTIDTYTGTAGDSLSYSNGMAFTTLDRDNDISKNNCAVTSIGAWWYKSCHDSNLNGQYVQSARDPKGMLWYFWKNNESTVKKTEMKLRRKGRKLLANKL